MQRQLQKNREEITRKEEMLEDEREKATADLEKLENVLIEADMQHKEEIMSLKTNVNDFFDHLSIH